MGKTFKIVDGDISDGYHTFDELYEHRYFLMLALMKGDPGAWYSNKQADGTMFPGQFIVGINMAGGAISYHLPERLWLYAQHTGARKLDSAPEWDGHNSFDVLLRLKKEIAECD